VGEVPSPRSLDDKIRSESIASPLAVFETDCGNSGTAGRDDDVLSTAILTDGNVGVSLDTPPCGEFD
jgi:hypothetical protein